MIQQKIHPKMQYTYVGVDSHRDSHTFVFINFLYEKLGELVTSSTPSDFPKFLKQAEKFLQPNTTFAFGFEDVSQYGRTIVKFLMNQGHLVKHVNVNLVASERNSRNVLQKTDSIDAECCARVLFNRFDELPQASDDDRFFILKTLVANRQGLAKQRWRLKRQLHNLLFMHYPSYPSFFHDIDIKSSIAFYESYPTPHTLDGVTVEYLTDFFSAIMTSGRAKKKATHILEMVNASGVVPNEYQSSVDFSIRMKVTQLKNIIEENDKIEQELVRFLDYFDYPLTSMKGIDIITACRLIAEIGDINRFKNPSALARYAGISPVTHESGNTSNQYANRRGNRQLNTIFYNLALFVSTPMASSKMIINPFFHDYYLKKLGEGKTKKQALKSVQRRLVNIIYGIMKYKQDYINPPVRYIEETGEIIEPSKNELTHQAKLQSSLK